ncbi:MAG TPA: alginate export family protein [Vicinamibacterales bacterium]|jgi:hypothetical protein
MVGRLGPAGAVGVLLAAALAASAAAQQAVAPPRPPVGEPAAAPAPARAGGQAKPPTKGEKVGLARLSDNWPSWLTVSIQERVRVEATRPPATRGAEYDGYLINRFRLTAAVRATPWLQATVQAQDSRVSGYDLAPVPPKSMENTFDLRLAYVEIGRKGARRLGASVGRQELLFGDGRLIASPDWGNVGRTYDAVRLTAAAPGFRIDLFGAAPVDVTPDAFSRAKVGERFYGTWVRFDRVKPLAYVEPYLVVKFNSTATGELGGKGDATLYTAGVRLGGPATKTVTWEAENVIQRGHSAADDTSAWASHEGVTWAVAGWVPKLKPRIGFEYNFASGDHDPKDGIKTTFDQLYASTHGKWGLGDNVGWRNLHHVAVKFEISPAPKLKVNAALNRMLLATVNDGWYGSSGSRIVLNRKATSRDLGWEPDLFGAYAVTKDLTVGAGLAVLFGGGFITQSVDVQRIWTPYVMWSYTF